MLRILAAAAAAVVAASCALATAQETAPPGAPGNPPTVYAGDEMQFVDTATGRRAQVRQGPSRTLSDLEVHITTLNPGQEPHGPHRHPHEEMMVLQTGRLEVYVDGQTKVVGPGSVLLYEANVWHGVRNVGDTPATYHVIAIHR